MQVKSFVWTGVRIESSCGDCTQRAGHVSDNIAIQGGSFRGLKSMFFAPEIVFGRVWQSQHEHHLHTRLRAPLSFCWLSETNSARKIFSSKYISPAKTMGPAHAYPFLTHCDASLSCSYLHVGLALTCASWQNLRTISRSSQI